MSDGIHSTGRGGAGNIGHEQAGTSYTDGSIVREGAYGESGGLDYSAGRGGAGNIGKSPNVRPVDKTATTGEVPPLGGASGIGGGSARTDADVVPETATRNADNAPKQYHVGRGGAGNAHHDASAAATATGEKHAAGHVEGEKKHEGLVEKIEHKVNHLLHRDHKETK